MLMMAAVACSMPGIDQLFGGAQGEATPAAPAVTPAPLEPLAPELVESIPARGEELRVDGSITLYFDQAMDKAAVEQAFSIEPHVAGQFTWPDEFTLTFSPSEPLQRETVYNLTIAVGALSSAGLSLTEPVNLKIHTVRHLKVAQVSPGAETVDVQPDAVVTVAFNRPVVPLQISGETPSPLQLSPSVPGKGEWVDTGIYVWRPDRPFPGGITFTASVEAGLADQLGGILEAPYTWTFTTALPRWLTASPQAGATGVALDAPITVAFNQPMDQPSVESSFSLIDASGAAVAGRITWDETGSVMTFEAQRLLDYDRTFSIQLGAAARGLGGENLSLGIATTFRTVPRPAVARTTPARNGVLPAYESLRIGFNAPMDLASLINALVFSPEVENRSAYFDGTRNELSIYGDFAPASQYTLTLDDTAANPHDTPLAKPFTLAFTTANRPPLLSFMRYGTALSLMDNSKPIIELQTRNISKFDYIFSRWTLDEALALLDYRTGIDGGEKIQQSSKTVTAPANAYEPFRLTLAEKPLPTGVYVLYINSPQSQTGGDHRVLVVRHVELVMKTTADKALVWAVDLNSGEPVISLPVRVLDKYGFELGVGTTDREGVAQFPISEYDPYDPIYAVSAEPGDPLFSMTGSYWSEGVEAYQFGLPADYVQTAMMAYVYTDRPIYRPGTPVRFRGVLRSVGDARYSLPDASSLRVTVTDPSGEEVYSQMLPLSDFGTFNGELNLNRSAAAGYYTVQTEYGSVGFQVASYRKPEFTVTVTPAATDVAEGDGLTAEISAQFFFGGPVAGAQVKWSAWLQRYFPPLLDRAIGWDDTYEDITPPGTYFDIPIEGEGTTDADGLLQITLPTRLQNGHASEMVVEATITDAAGLPVSGRTTVHIHPATVCLLLTPESYALRTNEEALVRLRSVNWNGDILAGQKAMIDVERLTWKQVVKPSGEIDWESEATPLLLDYPVITESNGEVSFRFTPEISGTYRVSATGKDPKGREASGQVTLWVTGSGAATWRQPLAGQLALVSDRTSYAPGDTAHILIPSPFTAETTALLTMERRQVLSHRIIQLDPSDTIIEVPIEAIHAPNVFVSVALISPKSGQEPPGIAVGLLSLQVDASDLELQVSLTPDKTKTKPGDRVTYQLRARDSQGKAVQAEFSLGLADLAALSLVEPNSQSPMEAFYSLTQLGVRTAASLTISAEGAPPLLEAEGRGGGGGEGEMVEIRREFPDTAYWNASVVTDSSGEASVTVELPDSLTTWRMDARGVTTDTLVGSTTVDLIATKDLLIRPVTPRFFTAGDAATVAAVVNNNTGGEIPVEVRLVANGADISTPAAATVTVPAGGEQRVEWSLVIHDTEAVDLTFHASGGGLQDASKPTIGSAVDGKLLVARFAAPDTAATSGMLDNAGERVEAVSLPRRFDATRGELRVVIDPSLGSAMTSALSALDHFPYECTEQVTSRLLANVAVYRALHELSIEDAELEADLAASIKSAQQTLTSRRKDEGWGWWTQGPTDRYLTAYGLYALSQVRDAGLTVDEYILDAAVEALRAGLVLPANLQDQASRDRQVLILFALDAASGPDLTMLRPTAQRREELSVWARALVAQMLGKASPSDPLLSNFLSDFESTAVRSATGVHWEDAAPSFSNLGSSVRTTAHVLQSLLLLDPDSPLIADTVRWLVHARDREGDWASTHESAWSILALTDWLKTSGGLEADFDYSLKLNNVPWSSGEVSPGGPTVPVELMEPVSELLTDRPNQVAIRRGSGAGSLFYTARLTVYRPIEDVQPTSRGLTVDREYFAFDGKCGGTDNRCPTAHSAAVGEELLVRVTVTTPTDQYYLALEDPFPAGTDPIDPHLLTSAQALPEQGVSLADPLRGGWGWWWFTRSELRDDRLFLFAEYLPAGTYQYTYILRAILPGEYRILPTRAWAFYFPEIYGQGTGRVFTIQP